MSGFLDKLVLFARAVFIDLRLIAFVMALWLIVIISIMIEIGIFANASFMSCGPRPGLTFMHVPIDTYYKYNMLIVMIIMHTFVTDVIADSLSPHVLNVVQDTRNRFIPHKPATYFSITTIWAIYCSISQLFIVFIAFAQFDLLVARLLSDVLANLFTTSLYLHDKTYDPLQYDHHHHHPAPPPVQEEEEAPHNNEEDDDEYLVAPHKKHQVVTMMTRAHAETEMLSA